MAHSFCLRAYSAILLFVLFAFSATGCGLFGEDEPQVNEVILVGTLVSPDFRTTGRFDLTAIPLDADGAAILSSDVRPSIDVEQPIDLVASASNRQVNKPSGLELAVALNIDASGSMSSTDPTDARLKGAKTLVQVLDEGRTPFEAAVFLYPPVGGLFQRFTSDVDTLEQAIDRIGSSGSTPTYSSLATVLDYVTSEKPKDTYDRSVVLLSDGQPGDAHLRPQVCDEAANQGIPIYAIGLGPASDIDDNQPVAVAEMRAIAECTNATYAGIDPQNVDSSATLIFNNIGLATSQGTLVFEVQLDGAGLERIRQGDIIQGIIALKSGGRSASASFSFSAP